MKRPWFSIFALILPLGLASCSQSPPPPATSAQPSPPGVEQAVSDAIDAHTYGYPLVTMDMTRKQLTKVPNATARPGRGAMGQLIKLRSDPAVEDHAVTAPSDDDLEDHPG
ncbi:MAG TPA: hypothetical protein VEC10_15175 [Steroidobacteraceae bacterium]|nr:hypothetical protein [Steroidobacteraceae bacterium]